MFTPPAQLNVFDFLFKRGEMLALLNSALRTPCGGIPQGGHISLGPLPIPLG